MNHITRNRQKDYQLVVDKRGGYGIDKTNRDSMYLLLAYILQHGHQSEARETEENRIWGRVLFLLKSFQLTIWDRVFP